MKKFILMMFLVVGLFGFVKNSFAYDIQVRSLLLPGFYQASQGQWVEAIAFFALDSVGIYLMTQTELQMSDDNGNVWKVKSYFPMYSGIGIYAFSGFLSTEHMNYTKNSGKWVEFTNISVKW